MKTFILIALAITSYLSGLFAQESNNAEQIIEKHINARGGAKAWNKIESIEYKGSFTGFSISKPFTTIQKNPNSYRSDFGLGKFDVVLAFDGEIGWTIDPWFDIPFPRELSKSELNVVKQKAEICSPFLNFKDKGYKVEYIGEVVLEGIITHKIKLIKDDFHNEMWYINAETYLELKQESMWDDFGYTTPQETYFDDFRTVDGLVIPHYIERSFIIRNRITEIEEITINKQVETTFFKMPLSPEMKKLGKLKGKWSVTIEALGRRGWYQTDSISVIIFNEHNLMHTKLSYTNYFKHNNLITWSFNANENNYRMTVFNGFSSEMNVYDGNYTNDTLVFNPITIVDSTIATDKTQYKISSLCDNKFTIEVAHIKGEGKLKVDEIFYFQRLE